jgi:hypothetical protein
MTAEATTTRDGGARHVRVLVVHGEYENLSALCDRLRAHFVVREAWTSTGVWARLAEASFTCVVGVLGIDAHGFLDELSRTSRSDAKHVLLIAPRTRVCVLYKRTESAAWMPEPTVPEDLLGITRAVAEASA